MQKLFKKLAALVAVLTLVVGCGMLTACGDKNGGETEIAYTVIYQADNKPVAEVQLKFCVLDEQGNESSTCTFAWTDANGVAKPVLTDEQKKEKFHVAIVGGMPEGYKAENGDLGDPTNEDEKGWLTETDGRTFTIKLVPIA